MNHFRKSSALRPGSGSRAGAAKIDGRSIQQRGISVMDFGARRKGGERVVDRSPLMEERIFAQSISYSRGENIEVFACQLAYRNQVLKLRDILHLIANPR